MQTKSDPAQRGLFVNQIVRRFGEHLAVDNISFTVSPGELVALVGASGSGKTTTLRMIAGYEHPDAGSIFFDGVNISNVAPDKRNFGMVFQHYALFPHMSVLENVAFGLEARGVSKSVRLERAKEALNNVGLASKAQRRVQQLSGGEQQRVALARAVVIEPRMLLMDEPLSNLDPSLRESTRDELRAAIDRVGAPVLFVTHDQEDAFAIADRVVILDHGKVLQKGTPSDIYDSPASASVAGFIGRSTLVPVVKLSDSTGPAPMATVKIGDGELSVQTRASAPIATDAGELMVVLRPEYLTIKGDHSEGKGLRSDGLMNHGWPGKVIKRRFAGASFVYTIASGGVTLEVYGPARWEVGDVVTVGIAVNEVPLVAEFNREGR